MKTLLIALTLVLVQAPAFALEGKGELSDATQATAQNDSVEMLQADLAAQDPGLESEKAAQTDAAQLNYIDRPDRLGPADRVDRAERQSLGIERQDTGKAAGGLDIQAGKGGF